jgi:hypothetical protein
MLPNLPSKLASFSSEKMETCHSADLILEEEPMGHIYLP